MDLGLQGRAALVTGASAGIGYAVARRLSEEGARVTICSRSRERIEAAARRIHDDTGNEVLAVASDVSDATAGARLVEETASHHGRLEILVTNAGGPPSGNFDDAGEDEFARAVELTFRSVERLVRAAVPHLRAAGWGRIVNLTSITVKEPHDGLLLSNSLRPAVHGFSKSLSKELGPAGITVNCVCPGFTNTERLRDLAEAAAARRNTTPAKIFEGWRANIPRGELGHPDEIADVVAFLCSEAASYVNGVSLAVDGGESHSLL